MRHTSRIAAAVCGVAALTLAGCGDRGDAPDAGPSPRASETGSAPAQRNPDFKACMVADSGGFEDRSVNQASHDGLEKARRELGVRTAAVASDGQHAFAGDIDSMAKQDCDIITTVGYRLRDATEAAAKQHPSVDFSIVDVAYDKPPRNVKGLVFDTAAPSFLAGYLAAGVSASRIVGTFGGAQLPSVTSFMDSFQAGVEQYNEDEGAEVQVLGWDREQQEGAFTNHFESRTLGRSTAAELITQGADVIFPVAGAAGLGALQAVEEADLKAIWVETDGCVSAAEYCDVLLTSVMKGMDVAVAESIEASLGGAFDNTPYTGTLGNGGVSLAPYREQAAAVPPELADRIEELSQQLIDGEIEAE